MRYEPTEQELIAEGEAAFWRANLRDTAQGTWWLMGWDRAATEAALLLQGEGHLIASGREVRAALTEAPAALRALTDMKTPFGLRRKAENAIAACERALTLITEGPKPGSDPSRSGAVAGKATTNSDPTRSGAVAGGTKPGSGAVAGKATPDTRSGLGR